MRRAISLLLVLALCLSLVACGGEVEETTSDVLVDAVVTEAAELPDIPLTADYGGYEFTFLSAGNFDFKELSYDEESSIPLDNAQYKRKLKVEKDYNVEIEEVGDWSYSDGNGPGFKRISQQVNAGDYTYDLALIACYDAAVLAYSGYLNNIGAIPDINLDKSWWDQNAKEQLKMGDVTFLATGDFTISNNKCAHGIMFNKNLLAEYNMESPYEVVRNGEWTIEYMSNMAKQVSEDLNSDGDFNEKDRYGLLVWDASLSGMVNAAGQRYATINEEGKIELTLWTEETLSALEQYADIAYDTTHAYRYAQIDSNYFVQMWTGDQALLFPTRLLSTVLNSRQMESDFGILPMPKLTASQEGYHHAVSTYQLPFMCFPLMIEDVERTGVLTEALSYYGQQYVLPALYDITIVGQGTRDVDSEEMLTVIFDSIVYDIGMIYQFGDYHDAIADLLRERQRGFSSMYESRKTQANALINLVNMTYQKALAEWQD